MENKIKFYSSPLYTFGTIEVKDDPSQIPQDFPEEIKDAISIPGSVFNDDPADDLEKWLESHYKERRKGYKITLDNKLFCYILDRSVSIEDIDLKKHLWETIEDCYHRILKVEFLTSSLVLPRDVQAELNERGYKEIPLNHTLVVKSEFLNY